VRNPDKFGPAAQRRLFTFSTIAGGPVLSSETTGTPFSPYFFMVYYILSNSPSADNIRGVLKWQFRHIYTWFVIFLLQVNGHERIIKIARRRWNKQK
jgi:hypothetical protein